jgi:hypothetical protein
MTRKINLRGNEEAYKSMKFRQISRMIGDGVKKNK